MFYDLDGNTNSYSNEFKSHMEDFIFIVIILLKSDKDFGSGKNMSWIFVQNHMKIDLVQYKVLHTTFELTRIRICISAHVIKHLNRNWSKPRKWCASLFDVKIGYMYR